MDVAEAELGRKVKYSQARDGRHDIHFESFSSVQTRDVSLFMCKIHMQETHLFYCIKVLKRAVGVVGCWSM